MGILTLLRRTVAPERIPGYGRIWIDANGSIRVRGESAAYDDVGSWTPVIAGSTTPGTNTYLVQLGRWFRRGNMMDLHFRVRINAIGSPSGNVTITGFPVAAVTLTNMVWSSAISWESLVTNHIAVYCQIASAGSNILVTGTTAAVSGIGAMPVTAIGNNSGFYGHISYEIA